MVHYGNTMVTMVTMVHYGNTMSQNVISPNLKLHYKNALKIMLSRINTSARILILLLKFYHEGKQLQSHLGGQKNNLVFVKQPNHKKAAKFNGKYVNL